MIYFSDFSSGGGGPTDPFFANTALLLSFDGADGSTTFTDESHSAHGTAPEPPSVGNDAQVDTAIKKFGTGSLLLNSGSDHVAFADHADWTLGGDFTIEGWFNFSAAEAFYILVAHSFTTGNQRAWHFDYNGSAATNILRFVGYSAGTSASSTVIVTGAWSPTPGTWHFLCAEKSGTTYRLYADGVMVGKATNAITLFESTAKLTIGDTDNTNTGVFQGNIDELRITLAARYNSDSGFTVPTAAFPRS